MPYELLAQRWSGLAIAALIAMPGLLLYFLAHRRWTKVAALLLLLTAGVSGGFAISALVRTRDIPPMGKLVDVGGYRLHILAEGQANGKPTIVWIPGAHSQGLSLHHLHKAMRTEARSILFDRPGTGWSDLGSFPLSTKSEAESLHRLLENAGEQGPFVVAGHSYGGLLAANFARRFPGKVAAVVLLDPTPPDVLIYMPGGGGPGIPEGLIRQSKSAAWRKMFGLWSNPEETLAGRNDDLGKLIRTIRSRLEDVRPAMDALQLRHGGDWAAASLFGEWFDAKLLAELNVYEGELGALPLYLVTPADGTDPKTVGEQMGLSGEEAVRAAHFLARARKRYMAASSKSVFVAAPAGTGHNFPYETPEFVIAAMRKVLAGGALE